MMKKEKNGKISAAAVLLPLMLIFAMFTGLGCEPADEGLNETALKAAIKEAKGLLDSTVSSDTSGSAAPDGTFYATTGELTAFEQAIKDAESAMSSAKAQADINTALNALKTATTQFKTQRTLKGGNNITINDLDGHNTKDISVYLYTSADLSGTPVADGDGIVASGTVKILLFNYAELGRMTTGGTYYVKIRIGGEGSTDYYKSSAAVNFTDTNRKPVVSFNNFTSMADEGEGITVTIQLVDIASTPQTVTLNISYYLEDNDEDYPIDFSKVAITNGEATVNIKISQNAFDALEMENATFRLVIDSFYILLRDYTLPNASTIDLGVVSLLNPDIPRNVKSLTINRWEDGDITDRNPVIWYSISANTGTYYLWWNDNYDGNETKTADIQIEAFSGTPENLIPIDLDEDDAAWITPASFTLSSAGTVYIKVTPYFNTKGTFSIVYSIDNDKPYIPLKENEWINDSIKTGIENIQFYTISVTQGTKYNIWWNDSYAGDGSKRGDIVVSAYSLNLDDEILFANEHYTDNLEQYDSAWVKPSYFTAGFTGSVVLFITGGDTEGTYSLVYSRADAMPAQ